MKKITFFFLILLSIKGFSQVVINEVASAADTGYVDEDGDVEDWIEFYNTSSTPVNLQGYTITRLEGFNSNSWTFPKIIIPAYGYVTIFCSGKNRKDYFDHWEVPVYSNNIWKYDAGTANPPLNWTSPTFNDASWLSGAGGIGYGDGDDSTVIAPTTALYMRKSFFLADTSKIVLGLVLLDLDDGFVAYLNGVEVGRYNVGIAGDHPTNTTNAYDEHEATSYQNGNFSAAFYVSAKLMDSALIQGVNTFAIQTHNYSAGMDDLTSIPYFLIGINDTTVNFFPFPADINLHTDFNLNTTGQKLTLKDASGTIVDQQDIGAMQMNNSRGRLPDGSNNWCLFNDPTGDTTNNNSVCFTGYAGVPSFQLPAGYYSTSQNLSINAPPSEIIHYTTDGGVPLISSPVYSSPLAINSTQVVRAKSFSTNTSLLPGTDITNTYFINDSSTLPVFSLSTDAYNLFDYNYGIYEFGPNADTTNIPFFGSNFWQNGKRPAHIEYFDENNNFAFETNSEISIQGNYSKAWPQKGFTVKAKDNYGGVDVHYKLFPDKPGILDFKNFNIRNAGSDWNTCHMRDRLNQKTVQKATNLDIMDGRSCLLFINGTYFGVYELREKQDENYLVNNYGVDKDKIDFLEFDGSVIAGSNIPFLDMVNYISTNPVNTTPVYDSVKKLLDIKNFADYFITETYIVNIDWLGNYTNNIKYWRKNSPASSWRYMLWDTDLSLAFLPWYDGSDTTNMIHRAISPPTSNPHSQMLSSVLQNTEFKNYFVNRYADLMNTIFRPHKFRASTVKMHDEMYPEMARHFQKWGNSAFWIGIGRSNDVPSWEANVDTMIDYMYTRPFYARAHIQNEFSLTKQVTVTLQTDPQDAGTIDLNTITPDSLPWNGIYYDGVPITMTAKDKAGFVFQYWKCNSVFGGENHNRSITYNVDTNDVFTAVYRKLTYNFTANPNPFVNNFTINYELPEKQPVSLFLFDVL
ncbi:MAG: CotH kinase family protein, partial [Bacteroidia bacterium]|nr:CotH kinase family protein [Bacteroidia bacterium]